jgi:hypothetical protein
LFRSLAGLRSWLLYTWLIFVGYQMLQSPRQLQQVYVAMLLLSIVTGVYGVYQWQQGPEALVGQSAVLDMYAERMAWTDEATGQRVFRAFSTFVMPGAFGHSMAMGLLVVVVLAGAKGLTKWVKYLAFLSGPIMAAGLVASGARTAMAGLALGILIIVFLRRGRGSGLILMLLVVGVWVSTSLTTNSVSSRYATLLDPEIATQWMGPLWHGIIIASDYPMGAGMGYTTGLPGFLGKSNVFSGMKTASVDSGVGTAAAELGFAGMLIFIFLMVQLAICPLRVWRLQENGVLKELTLIPVAFAVITAVSSVSSGIAASPPFSIYFWILVGMTFRVPYLLPPRSQSRMEAPPCLASTGIA